MQILRQAFKKGGVSHVKQAGYFAPLSFHSKDGQGWLARLETLRATG
jgi:hypothetical protein